MTTVVKASFFSAQSILETMLIVVLTICAGLLFFISLNALFPIGTGLGQDLYFFESRSQGSTGKASGNMQLLQGNQRRDFKVEQRPDSIASLTQTKNNVRSKPAGGVTWKMAKQGKRLFSGDSIQTGAKSDAAVVFDDKNFLRINEKSLVVIQRIEKDLLLAEKQSVVVMTHGDIWGRVEKNQKQSTYLEIITPDISTRIGGRSGQETEFNLNVTENRKSTLTVFSGAVEVTHGQQTLLIEKNQRLEVDKKTDIATPQKLLPAVTVDYPNARQTVYYQDLAPMVKFDWQKVSQAKDYRLLIATDPGFLNITIDVLTSNSHFSYGNLREGKYYWRVFAKQGSQYGDLGDTRQLALVRDLKPPVLKVKFADVANNKGLYEVIGETEPGAVVFVGGQKVTTDASGGFSYSYPLKPGINQIVVESMDEAKNMSYKTHTFNFSK